MSRRAAPGLPAVVVLIVAGAWCCVRGFASWWRSRPRLPPSLSSDEKRPRPPEAADPRPAATAEPTEPVPTGRRPPGARRSSATASARSCAFGSRTPSSTHARRQRARSTSRATRSAARSSTPSWARLSPCTAPRQRAARAGDRERPLPDRIVGPASRWCSRGGRLRPPGNPNVARSRADRGHARPAAAWRSTIQPPARPIAFADLPVSELPLAGSWTVEDDGERAASRQIRLRLSPRQARKHACRDAGFGLAG